MKPSEPESPATPHRYTAPSVTGSVWTTFEVVGFHNWPDAFEEVDHLRSRHRHLFKIRLEVGVSHTERAIEFQALQHNAKGFFFETFAGSKLGLGIMLAHDDFEFHDRSCETIAQALMGFLIDFYPSSDPYEVTVSEDGESGATLRVDQR